jgi:N-hydroxyarylamine O-acetyltransferase
VPGFIAGPPNEAGMQERCTLLQTEANSPFVQNAVVFRRTPEGFISLLGRVLRTIRPDGIAKAEIDSADEYVATLKARFDLDLPEAAALWPAICARHEEIMREQAARRAAQAAAQS